jgi:hypothetical protein
MAKCFSIKDPNDKQKDESRYPVWPVEVTMFVKQ